MKSSTYYFHLKMKTLADFQICISVPLIFILFMVRSFFLLIHFLVVEDFELPKSTTYILSVLLPLESWSTFFFWFHCFPDDVLCKIAIWADETALNSSFGKPSDLLQQAYKLLFDLKNMKMQYLRYQKVKFCIQLYIHTWEIIL